ncbi:MAG: XisI protein [Chloroflexota bacterium]|jgi:hypothetical protein|nr:XisI protein [Chloroflexota bacterium]
MDTLNLHQVAQTLLAQYAEERYNPKEIEAQLVCDVKNGHYQLIYVGWRGDHRIYTCLIHLDVKGDKIWLQQNMTDEQVAEDLLAMGVAPNQIVLAIHSPFRRQFTKYAVN